MMQVRDAGRNRLGCRGVYLPLVKAITSIYPLLATRFRLPQFIESIQQDIDYPV